MGIPKLYFYGDIEGLVPALKGLEGDGYFRLCGKDEGGFPVKAESGAENMVIPAMALVLAVLLGGRRRLCT